VGGEIQLKITESGGFLLCSSLFLSVSPRPEMALGESARAARAGARPIHVHADSKAPHFYLWGGSLLGPASPTSEPEFTQTTALIHPGVQFYLRKGVSRLGSFWGL
jgi:hypothetical protein